MGTLKFEALHKTMSYSQMFLPPCRIMVDTTATNVTDIGVVLATHAPTGVMILGNNEQFMRSEQTKMQYNTLYLHNSRIARNNRVSMLLNMPYVCLSNAVKSVGLYNYK